MREFRLKLKDLELGTSEISTMMTDLNHILILQDLSNACLILRQKAGKLRKRLTASNNQIKQMNESGNEMDGNTSTTEEDEFIEAMTQEMPNVYKNIDSNFKMLAEFEEAIGAIEKNRDPNELIKIKTRMENLSQNVTETEGLANKLEAEILGWNAHKKLIKRDVELDEIDN